LKLRRRWQATSEGVLNLLFPPRCVSCQRGGGWICPACHQEIEFIRPPLCPRCGQATSSPRTCPSCRSAPLRIDGIRAVAYLEDPLRTAIHRFKYSNLRSLAPTLGKLASDYLAHNELPIDVTVPVPLHAQRLKGRGYNQATLLAREIHAALHIPLMAKSLVRVRSTDPQVGLNAKQRTENVRGAFRCTDQDLKGRRVLLVDDVCTTGATLEACSIALQQAGARQVWGLVLARERWQER
jgi:ComF family protein